MDEKLGSMLLLQFSKAAIIQGVNSFWVYIVTKIVMKPSHLPIRVNPPVVSLEKLSYIYPWKTVMYVQYRTV